MTTESKIIRLLRQEGYTISDTIVDAVDELVELAEAETADAKLDAESEDEEEEEEEDEGEWTTPWRL